MSKKKQSTQKKTIVRMGVPTVAQRLARIERSLRGIAGVFEFDLENVGTDDIRTLKGMALDAADVRAIAEFLCAATFAKWELDNLPAEILNELAPTSDQRESFEQIEPVAAGAR